MLRLIAMFGIAVGLSTSCMASETLVKSKDGTLLIESLPHSVNKEFDGCACTFSSPRDQTLTALAWDYSSRQSSSVMQVNGRTERLSLVAERSRRKKGRKAEPQNGDSTEYKFASESVSATLQCKVSQTCWGTPGCEYVGYSCSANVSGNGGRVKFSVDGGCGC